MILVLNGGSSSLKFELFDIVDEAPVARLGGQVEGIGATPVLRVGATRAPIDGDSHSAALAAILSWLDTQGALVGITAVGHRVVHGGPHFDRPLRIDAAAMDALRELVPLAPLHQPHNLAGIEAASARFPKLPQVACFDTAFHRTHPWVADTFALPPEFHERGIRRYGFHGLSYEWIVRALAAEDPVLARGRLVVAHLGNGASLCAIADGRSRDSTMGFTALDGLPMGTRCGQIDPGVLLHLLEEEGMTPDAVGKLLYGNSGLKGMSGISQDVRELEASRAPEAAQALQYFAYRVRREIGAMAAVLGGIDALVFTAGIGEHAAGVRARIVEGLDHLGLAIDPARNEAGAPDIGVAGRPARVLVRPTDEERMIAVHVLEVLRHGP